MGGRVVKTIGDEVMFIFDTPEVAVDVALRLVTVTGTDVPPLRIGLARGPVLVRQGDCYGSTVNLASRIASVAKGGDVLVDTEVASAVTADSRFVVSSLGAIALKGFGPVAVSRAVRAH